MKNLSIMIKPASALCNLRCKYCFYTDVSEHRTQKNYGIMTSDTMSCLLKNVRRDLEIGDKIQFVFQGGEPALAGLDFYRNFVSHIHELYKGIKVSYALQTNAVLLNEEWCEFLKEHNFLVGVSLDILADCHDSLRIDQKGNGTYKQVLRAIQLLKDQNIEHNILCTLTDTIARHPQQVWNQMCKLDIKYIQFTPCLDDFDCETRYSLTPKRFASFYTQLFKLWSEDMRQGKYRSVKFFDDTINLMIFGKPTCCGMNGKCGTQIVVEADGSVYPCDFYCTDEYKIGDLTKTGFMEIISSAKASAFINRPHQMPSLCDFCRYTSYCGGNCKRMQKQICCSQNDMYCGYMDFLNNCGTSLSKIAEVQYKKYAKNL